jgi:hypothetical protein
MSTRRCSVALAHCLGQLARTPPPALAFLVLARSREDNFPITHPCLDGAVDTSGITSIGNCVE